jgi:hypothetical protein
MQKVVAVVTITFFVTLAFVVVVGGWSVIFPGSDPSSTTAACTPAPCEMPTAPEPPAPPVMSTDTAAFSQQISA